MAQIDQSSHNTALAIFKCKFTDAQFEVRELTDILNNQKALPVQMLRENNIQIANYNFLLEFLRLFGQAVRKFSIDFQHTPVASCKKIIRSLRLYCESLTQLDLFGSRGFELNDVDTPFESVQNVSVSGVWKKWGSNTLNFPQIFPNLRRLEIKTQGFSIDTPQSIVKVYENLQHLHIAVAHAGETHDGQFLELIVDELLKLNPTIQSLSLVYCSERFLKDVITALPYLESLKLNEIYEIENQPYNGDPIVMEHVRNLEISSLRITKPVLRQTTFPQLEELTLDLNPLIPDELNTWLDFIGKHKTIVFLKAYGFVKDQHLQRFRTDLPELTNVIVRCDRSVTTAEIAKFVQQSNQLIIFDLRGLNDVKTHYANLGRSLGDEWKVQPFVKERRLIINRKM